MTQNEIRSSASKLTEEINKLKDQMRLPQDCLTALQDQCKHPNVKTRSGFSAISCVHYNCPDCLKYWYDDD